ncbi:unnamed protein product [Lactuca virosa]|uniref:Uncharacterized protein n=1 Tax=Lactuca virosa TaxID=75947 RepID=A0AAU9LQN1_9ASTR|nr:unnamed protein product [Lactuca virosa]
MRPPPASMLLKRHHHDLLPTMSRATVSSVKNREQTVGSSLCELRATRITRSGICQPAAGVSSAGLQQCQVEAVLLFVEDQHTQDGPDSLQTQKGFFHSDNNAPNPKQNDLPPSYLPSSDNFTYVAIFPKKRPEVPLLPDNRCRPPFNDIVRSKHYFLR